MAVGPLDGASVVVTRPRSRSRALLDLLDGAGASTAEVPLVDVGPPADGGAALAQAIGSLVEGSWLVLTSASSVGEVLRVAPDPTDLARIHIAAVGPATAAALSERGLKAEVIGDGTGGAALGGRLVDELAPGSRVLLAQADNPSPGLAEVLRAAELELALDEVTAYSTRARAPRPAEFVVLADADLIVVASPSAVRSLCAAFAEAGRPCSAWLVAIGATTAAAATQAALADVVVAEHPGPVGLYDAVVTAWSGRARGA